MRQLVLQFWSCFLHANPCESSKTLQPAMREVLCARIITLRANFHMMKALLLGLRAHTNAFELFTQIALTGIMILEALQYMPAASASDDEHAKPILQVTQCHQPG